MSSMVAETAKMTIPYACAALGGVLSERSGIVNIALEGMLLTSAFVSVATVLASGSPALGVAAGIAAGAGVGLIHALLVARGRVDAIVSGLALNLAAAGGTRFALRALYGSSSNSPSVHDVGVFEGGILFLGATIGTVALVAFALQRTKLGLRLRACGEDPAAAEAVGIHVVGTRTLAVVLGGAVCGLGGSSLAYDLHQFQAAMTGGRGFIALAAVIVAGWRPGRAAIACLAFAALDAFQIVVQNRTHVPPQLLAILPFVATLAALVLVSRRRAGRAPGGLGRHAS